MDCRPLSDRKHSDQVATIASVMESYIRTTELLLSRLSIIWTFSCRLNLFLYFNLLAGLGKVKKIRRSAGRADELGKTFRGKTPAPCWKLGRRVMKCTVSLGSKAKQLIKL